MNQDELLVALCKTLLAETERQPGWSKLIMVGEMDGGEWLLRRAFDGLGRERVFGYCDPANRSAAHCLRVLGFEGTGLAPYNGHQAAQFRLGRVAPACLRTVLIFKVNGKPVGQT